MSLAEAAIERLRRAEPVVLDTAVGLGLATVALAILAANPNSRGSAPPWLAVALIVVASVPLAVRRRWPIAVLVDTAIAAAAGAWFGASLNVGGLGLLVALFTVAYECQRRMSITVVALMPLYLLGIDAVFLFERPVPPGAVVANIVANIFIFGVVWVSGDLARSRRERTAALEARAARFDLEREEGARKAVAAERALIARELHDVVAHSVSVIVVQAGAARRVLDERPDQAREALVSIERTGREALVEMRRLLDVLRTDDEPVELGPQRGIGALGGLVAQVGQSGLPVELVVDGEPPQLEPGIDLAAYRIVQEALTNVLRHGGGRARVKIGFADDTIAIVVEDDGQPLGAGRRNAGRASDGAPDGHGHGIVGMSERASFYGGTLEAGPRPGGGFVVRASLPTGSRS